MNKPPAFQFYADDFLAGTFDMSTEEVGAYIRLLCHQWNRGSIPVEPNKQQRLAGGSVSPEVAAKFKLGTDGQLRNERLELERKKQNEFRAKQAEKGRKSGESRRNQSPTTVEPRLNHGCNPVEPTHEPDTNSPSPSPKERKKKSFEIPTLEQVRLAAQKAGMPEVEADKFFYHYDSKGWKVGKEPMKSLGSAIGGWATRWRSAGNTNGSTRPKADHEGWGGFQ